MLISDEIKLDSTCGSMIDQAGDMILDKSINGYPVATYQGVKLHSQIDPQKEAKSQLDSVLAQLEQKATEAGDGLLTCYILGAGLGYIVKPLQEFANQKYCKLTIVAVELIPEIARAALSHKVWEASTHALEWIVSIDVLQNHYARAKDKHIFVIANSASFRINRAAYESALYLKMLPTLDKKLNILVPTPLYGGSHPIALHCADAFTDLGHKVELLDFSEYYSVFKSLEQYSSDKRHGQLLQNMFASILGEVIVAKAIDVKADLVWAVAQTPLTPTSLQELRSKNITTALWFVEDYKLFTYWKEVAKHYDTIFTIQRAGFSNELSQYGNLNSHYLPLAANPKVHKPIDLSEGDKERYGSDVSFVGAGYHNRRMVFESLKLNNFKIWGNDWPNSEKIKNLLQNNSERVTTEETNKIFNATKINVNLHSSQTYTDVNPQGDFVNPRTFEIAASGSFQLVDERSELQHLFESDELITFRHSSEIEQLVNHYINNESERKAIAEKSQIRVMKYHTYTHRMDEALKYLMDRHPMLRKVRENPNSSAALKKAVSDDQELISFLAKYDDEEELNLDKIVSDIHIGNGELSRAEALFLLMKEFRDWGVEKGVIA